MLVTKNVVHWFFGGSFYVHFMLTCILTGIALILFLPGDTLSSSNGYVWFVRTAPHTDNGWAALFGIGAIAGWTGLMCDRKWVKLASVTLVCFFHLILATGAYESNHLSTGTLTYGTLAFSAIWLILKIGMEARV